MAFKVSDEFKVGVLATFGLLILILGYSFLKGRDVLNRSRIFYVKYEKIDGLAASAPVRVNGYVVGKVLSLELQRSGEITGKINVRSDIDIPQNSIAKIVSADLLGEKAVDLILGDSQQFAQSGDTLISQIDGSLTDEVRKELLPVKKKAEDLFSSIDSVLTVVKTILSEGSIETSIQNISNATGQFAHTAGTVDSLLGKQVSNISLILSNLESITRNFKENEAAISAMLKNFASISDSIQQSNIKAMISDLSQTMAELKLLTSKINEGEGSMGLLINDKKLYNNLDSLTQNMDRLMIDLRQNPSRYVHFSMFGRKPK